ncbi:MAG: T3SS effector HopA1 family protein [Aphanizomenon gracile PMC644.10]|nr:T3SS effector HopA1 family protein [Aphanizomenon gracile PMC644.10]
MQVLDSVYSQLFQLPKELQTALKNIVDYLEIESFYAIKHPTYKLLELPESLIARFKNLSLDIQTKHLSIQLRNFLYSAYYNGSWDNSPSADTQINNLSNNSLFGMDLAFYERLHTSNTGGGYWSHNWLVVEEEEDCLAVQKNGLTLHIERDLYLSELDKSAHVGNLVAIKMPKNLVQNGFYMAVSNLGTQGNQDIVRIYFNVSPEGAVSVMENVTKEFNNMQVPFSFKALYNPDQYRRYDSAVLYFNKHEYKTIYPILQKIYLENQDSFSQQVPLFTKQLAPGLGCAEEPTNKLADKESFGTNRCQIIANGLIAAWQVGNNHPNSRITAILEQFALHKINLQYPYLNPDSKDIYTTLDG